MDKSTPLPWWRLSVRGLLYHKRVNIAVALGVAAASAVLSGALIVGESMRGSLRELTLDRLGAIDIVVATPGYFSESLAIEDDAVTKDQQIQAVPIIFFPNGTVEQSSARAGSITRRASSVSIIGCRKDFWELFADTPWSEELGRDEIVLNQTLANDLGIGDIDPEAQELRITIGIPDQKLLPSDSALGEKLDLVHRIVNLRVRSIIPSRGPGRFGLHPTQLPPRNAFVSLELLQRELTPSVLKYKSDSSQANMLLLDVPDSVSLTEIQNRLSPSAEDMGLRIKRVTQVHPVASEPGQEAESQTIFDYFSISSDRLVIEPFVATSIRHVFPDAADVFVYMVNEMYLSAEKKSVIPFSITAGIDFDRGFAPVSLATKENAVPLGDQQIALTEWAATNLDVKIGDQLSIVYFEPESTSTEQTELTAHFTVADILKLTEPETPFDIRRGRVFSRATFQNQPQVTNDPDLTPEVPGLTDAASIDAWDLPFETADKIRPEDDQFWEYYRTTPKAYLSLAESRRLWASRFGDTTSFRVRPTEGLDELAISRRLLEQFKRDGHLGGIQVIPIRAQGLQAASGATPFDVLFLMLSMFVIGSALILVSLLFKLGMEQRGCEIGLLQAVGFKGSVLNYIWLLESIGVCAIGALVGSVLGIVYAWLMLLGLKTWWLGAIATPFLDLHASWSTMVIGATLGILVCLLTIYWSIRRFTKVPAKQLLLGANSQPSIQGNSPKYFKWLAGCAIALAGLIGIVATQLVGESQAAAFLFVGFLALVAMLLMTWQRLSKPPNTQFLASLTERSHGLSLGNKSLLQLAMSNANRHPLRSTLTIGLVAVAAFMILAISAFRLSPTEEGTAGFDFVAQTNQPVYDEIERLADGATILRMRYKTGEDASCNNLFQSTQPRVLGVTQEFIDYFDQAEMSFAWFGHVTGAPEIASNPWRVLDPNTSKQTADTTKVVPVVIDKNTAWYSLKVYLPGQEFSIKFDSGEEVQFRLVGLLDNTVLQGSLLIGEPDFVRRFPDIAGYRYFLIKGAAVDENGDRKSVIERLSGGLADQGFESRSTVELLAGFLAVQNTYLSTFQSLGALGLLLGTFGLASVQARSVFERRKELALLRAVGFSNLRLKKLVLMENVLLLFAGLAIGSLAALLATTPFAILGRAGFPWRELVAVFVVVSCVGLATSWLTARSIEKLPILQSLRV
ncbi:MAG TPA: FtsX-like permease family protein [Pirellulaceae bacterium]|nr:FtsX-like permease family protein [Pirellulaceae bacterium]HMO92306.1 FtsX-like permease family protein [Pirellulaceae bacterium]HMP69230.1 FtsX-like permease family protein [Pirellulaceae bacterium]